MQFGLNDREFKGLCSGSKKHCIAALNPGKIDKNVGGFLHYLTSKLYKIKAIEAIAKIRNSIGPVPFPL